MGLPKLNHLQFLVINVLLQGDQSGRSLREALKKDGVKKSGPAFYQLMKRLEESGLVEGWYQTRVIDGQTCKERFYKATGTAERAWEATREFYAGKLNGIELANG